MKFSICLSCAFAYLLLFVLPLQAAPQTNSLDELLKTALDNSPLVREIEVNVAEREATAIETKRLANPELDSEVGIPYSWKDDKGNTEISVSLTQPFRLSHGPLRNRVGRLLREAGGAEREQAILELIAKIKLTYARIWILSDRERLLNDVRPKIASLNDFVKKGLNQAAYGAGDEAVFRAEYSKTEAQLLGLKADRLLAEAELARLVGSSVPPGILKKPDIASKVTPALVEQLFRDGSLKAQRRAKILLDLANAQNAVADRDAFPELRPRIVYSRSDDGKDFAGVGLSFDLPFYSQNSAERVRTSASQRFAQAQNTYYSSDVFKDAVLKSATTYEMRFNEAQIYETRVLPAMREAMSAFETQVRSGQGSIFQLWQTLREYIDTDEKYLELWTQAFSQHQELSILLGEGL